MKATASRRTPYRVRFARASRTRLVLFFKTSRTLRTSREILEAAETAAIQRVGGVLLRERFFLYRQRRLGTGASVKVFCCVVLVCSRQTKRNFVHYDIIPGAYAPRLAKSLSFFTFFAYFLRISAAPREFFRRLKQPRSSGSEGLFCERGCSSYQQCGRGLPRAGSSMCVRGSNVLFAVPANA